MRKFLMFLVVVALLLAGAFYAFSEPDVPRSVLELKYAAPASEFVVLPDGAAGDGGGEVFSLGELGGGGRGNDLDLGRLRQVLAQPVATLR